MKRLAATALAFLFAWLLFIPFFATSSVSNLPACCRKTGKHHCTLSETNQSSSLQERCLYSGHLPVSAFPHNYVLTGAAELACNRYAGSSPTAVEIAGYPTLFKNASQQRGPPSLPLS